MDLPSGDLTGSWESYNGVYRGFVWTIPSEDDLPVLGDRDEVKNPDDPDGDCPEVIAWWTTDHLRDNPAVREELHADMNNVLRALEG